MTSFALSTTIYVAVVLFLLLSYFGSQTLTANQNRSLLVAERYQSHTATAVKGNGKFYARELARLDYDLRDKIALSAARPGSWLHLDWVANAYIKRARLTGNYNDYIEAESALRKAFAITEGQAGPVMTRAELNFSLHRLSAVEPDLIAAESALLVDNSTLELINEIRADVWFYSAQYIKAINAYRTLEKLNPSTFSASRLAHYHAHIGDFQTAEAWFTKAVNRVVGRSPRLRSWLHLQLGILDFEQGRRSDALTHYREAQDRFPGYWLVEEHIAEIYALQGRTNEAEKIYRELVLRTDSPMFMVALADILHERDTFAEESEAARWITKANQAFTAIAQQLPELISGHALDYFIQNGVPERTLEMAQDNYQNRPGGKAAVNLIQVHTALGQLPEALTLLEKLLSTPFRSADLYATAGVVFRANGQLDRAIQQEKLALMINPFAITDIAWLGKTLNYASSQLDVGND